MNEDFEPINLFSEAMRTPSCSQLFQLCSTIEPTPIGPKGVVTVSTVSMKETSWSKDKSFLTSLREVLAEQIKGSNINTNTSLFNDGLGWSDRFIQKMRNHDYSSDGSFSSTTGSSVGSAIFRSNQLEQWSQRYQELVEFRSEFNHCLVPLNWPRNPSLAHWVKRQRHQYRMKKEGKHSTMTPDRQQLLESLGFVWDSHAAGWEERWKELRDYRERHGHCKVPKKYPRNPQLSVWVKCQRRQFKLFCEGRDSNMTKHRIEKLLSLGFIFSPRLQKKM